MRNKKLSDYLVCLEFNNSKNDEVLPHDIASQSSKKYWWTCQKGHEWEASCNMRIGKGRNCPYCSNQKVCNDNCLAVLFPKIAKEWHPTKNNNITPHEVIAGTATHYWWQCQKGHEWKASCVKRTRMNRGCPICKESHGEKAIRSYLEKNNIPFDFQVKFKTCKRILPLIFDFIVYKEDLYCIEYQGEQHYKQVEHFKDKINLVIERDNIKRKWCQDNNIKFLEISYLDYKNIESILENFLR